MTSLLSLPTTIGPLDLENVQGDLELVYLFTRVSSKYTSCV